MTLDNYPNILEEKNLLAFNSAMCISFPDSIPLQCPFQNDNFIDVFVYMNISAFTVKGKKYESLS